MATQDQRNARTWVLDDLASAQEELVGDMVAAIQRVRAARAALTAARSAGLGPDAVCFTDEAGRPVTVEQLQALVSGWDDQDAMRSSTSD